VPGDGRLQLPLRRILEPGGQQGVFKDFVELLEYKLMKVDPNGAEQKFDKTLL
jgi:hypothetical protein